MIYLFGGLTEAAGGQLVILNDLWEYDISKEVWTLVKTIGTRPDSRIINAVIAYNETLYILGGGGDLREDSLNRYYDDIWKFNYNYTPLPWLILIKSD